MSSQVFEAIRDHDAGRLRTLLTQGFDPNEIDDGWLHLRPLHAAIVELDSGASTEMIEVLLEAGANINLTFPGLGGGTPLLGALFNGEWEAAKLLLDAGADPNVRGEEGDLPLNWCAERGNLEFASLLLAKGAGRTIDVPAGFSGMSALGQAAHRLNAPMVSVLLAGGAKPEAIDMDRRTARQRMPPYDLAHKDAWLEVTALLAAPQAEP